jgi:hypothetical protein
MMFEEIAYITTCVQQKKPTIVHEVKDLGCNLYLIKEISISHPSCLTTNSPQPQTTSPDVPHE